MKKLIGVLTLLLWSLSTFAQDQERVEIFFHQGSSIIDRSYVTNDDMLNLLTSKLTSFVSDSTITVSKIEVESYTSPEGGLTLNDKLSRRRAQVVCDYINDLGLNIPDTLLEVRSNGIAWDELRQVVSESDMSHKDQVIKIIDEVPEETWAKTPDSRWLQLIDSRNKHLMDLNYGKSYRYMNEKIFPNLRKSSVVTIYFKKDVKSIADSNDKIVADRSEERPTEIRQPEPMIKESSDDTILKPLFALKTNLLFDAVSVLNIELEVLIKKHWSIAGEWIFPWWHSNSRESSDRNALQILNGNIEGKYWFGDRTNRPVMTGWHIGIYAGGGLYDLERNTEGYQGEFFIAAGLSGGYAHTINKSGSLRMEYSVGVGYLKTDYDKYAEHWGIDNSWHTIRQESGNYTWIGPTRARVSLVWMLNRKVNKEK